MRERLQKLISGAGLASRRAAEELIKAGRVTVNGAAASLGDSADPDADIIAVDGVELRRPERRMYVMLNKPRGYVTTLSDEKGRRTVAELVSGAGRRLYPVGRLDLMSEGLLILTDDGEAANALMHPAHEVEKEYAVTVEGAADPGQLKTIRSARSVDGKPIKPPRVSATVGREGDTRLRFIIHEGRNREIRKLCAMAGMKVRRLVRVREGELRLGALKPGAWRELEPDELQYVLSLIKNGG